MTKEVIIGRNPSSPLKVPDDRIAVSGKHVKLTVTDEGKWKIEDLNSSNGTFVRNEEGMFDRVYTKDITEFDVIRLGNDGANSYVFIARRAFDPEDSYRKEFRHLSKLLKKSKEEEERKEHRIELNGWISKLSGVAVVVLCAVLGSIDGINIDANVRIGLAACAPIIVGLFFSGDKKALKILKKKKERFMICPNPNCGRRLTEFDIEQGQCPKCKAK